MADFDWGEAGTNLLNTSLNVWAAREGAKLAAPVTTVAPAQQAAMTTPEVDNGIVRDSASGGSNERTAAAVPWYRRKLVIGAAIAGALGVGYYVARNR